MCTIKLSLVYEEWISNLQELASHNFRYNFDEFHNLGIREDNFNTVLDDLVTVPKFVKQSIPQKQIYVFKNVIIR